MEKYNYIIYHNNCIDGFTGFYLFLKTDRWEKRPIVYPDQPHSSSVPPSITGKNVIIIDVAYSANVLKQIAKKAKKVLFIDHHISIAKDVAQLRLGEPHEIVYNKKHSGASLVWKHFHKGPMPRYVKYVEDNDTGRWKYEETLPFIAGLEVNLKLSPTFETLKKWDQLLKNKYVDKLIEEGTYYLRYKNFLINKFAKKYSLLWFPSKMIAKKHKMKPKKYRVAVINGGCPNVSLLGRHIVNSVDCDFCIIYVYIVDKQKYNVSLRSKDMDISWIAKRFGGGGHERAAAFSFSSLEYDISELFESVHNI